MGVSPFSTLSAPENRGAAAPALQPGIGVQSGVLHSRSGLGGTWPLRRMSFAKLETGKGKRSCWDCKSERLVQGPDIRSDEADP